MSYGWDNFMDFLVTQSVLHGNNVILFLSAYHVVNKHKVLLNHLLLDSWLLKLYSRKKQKYTCKLVLNGEILISITKK